MEREHKRSRGRLEIRSSQIELSGIRPEHMPDKNLSKISKLLREALALAKENDSAVT